MAFSFESVQVEGLLVANAVEKRERSLRDGGQYGIGKL